MTALILMLPLFLLSACSGPSEHFDCPPGSGVGCQSISKVNTMVNDGLLGGEAPCCSGKSSTSSPPLSVPHISFSDKATVRRTQDESIRVWIAPFQDEEGNFHEASRIHTILKPGTWSMGH